MHSRYRCRQRTALPHGQKLSEFVVRRRQSGAMTFAGHQHRIASGEGNRTLRRRTVDRLE